MVGASCITHFGVCITRHGVCITHHGVCILTGCLPGWYLLFNEPAKGSAQRTSTFEVVYVNVNVLILPQNALRLDIP